jgi:FkbM family methyltransferase
MGIKSGIAQKLLPAARLYIRYSPVKSGRSRLFKMFSWRTFEYTARTRYGAKMRGSAADLVQGFIYYFGVWEPNLSAFISSRLKGHSDRTFVDVGANVGYYSLLAAPHVTDGSVVAIEAFPAIFKKLETNVGLNEFKNIRLIAFAVTDVDRDLMMFHAGAGNEGATTSLAGKFSSAPVKVSGRPLPSLLTERETKSIKLIKIDVEGAEYSVVCGLKQMIKDLPPDAEVVIEITPSAYSGGQLAEVYEIFKSAGFFPYSLENSYSPNYYIDGAPPSRPTMLPSLPTKQTDVVFSKVSADFLA